MNVNNVQTRMVRLGDYIEIYDLKNIKAINLPFFGINKDKTFMPTVANTNGLDKSKYKIVEKDVFVFSGMQTGRDVCIRLALYDKDDSILVSPAYTTFTVNDKAVILPQYLFIQFNRFQMDRYGWFLSDGSIRSNLDWSEFCKIKIPLPDIDIQQELVDTYNGLKALAEQNEALINPLTQACQAYIVDCKKKYPEDELGNYIEELDERNTEGYYTIDDVKGISTEKKFIETKANLDGVSLTAYKVVNSNEFAYVADTSRRGDKIALALNSTNKSLLISSIYTTFRSIDSEVLLPEYIYLLLSRKEFDRYSRYNSWGSARETFDWSELCRVRIPLPPPDVQQAIVNLYNCAEEAKKIASEAREKMKTLCPALVQRAING
ncbi:restriction endonuclease subunit S [Marinifilum sp. D737]|uniref:restriction endonuclease subunit S n=1 Tax=Marinifilum sp. D737 TaxID=2969628 RepID=UPI002273C401|nr:restriction endonuclease subunit S [Marinifilum sp. D737]MCY1636589.1 restriction endonuclease subunit S [Marinifilum sp. D737]